MPDNDPRITIVRADGQPTRTVQTFPNGSRVTSVGERTYVVIQDNHIVREGNYAAAFEARDALKPVGSERLFLHIP